MNLHRSDINLYPKSCELVQHCSTHGCDFNKDVEISILEHFTGSMDMMNLQEEKWITRLYTKVPKGLNERLTDFAKLYYSLYK